MCDCFTCTHKNPRERAAYYKGYVEACDWFLDWAAAFGVKPGSIADSDLGGITAQMKCNRDESEILRREMVELYKSKHRETQKAWARANRKKINKSAKKYYNKHKETIKAKNLERYYKSKETKDEGTK